MMHKSTTTSWVRPTNNFIPAPELGRPPGGSSPVIHFFRDQDTGERWIGKLGQIPLRDKDVLEAARQLPGFLGVYADEILEKLGLAVYQLLGTEVPESTLSYQQVTMEAMHPDMLLAMQLNAEDEGHIFELSHSPRMHYLSRYVEEFLPLDKDFVEHYLANAKRCGNEYVKIQTRHGEMLPLRGLGSMLAAADFLYDLDCLGDSCGNAGCVIKEDRTTGERYVQLVKIDAGYAFSYSDLRTDQKHNPRDRQIRVAPNRMRLQFADLAPVDQREFAATSKRILAIPYEEFAHLFSQTEKMQEGISVHHWQQLLDELIARKSLFLKAFAPETDRTIIKEIETAQAKVANKFQSAEELSTREVEALLAHEKEEAIALAELRVRLAVLDTKQNEPKKLGECKTFQLQGVSTHFVGREEALAQLVKQLNQNHGSIIGQSISGIGGVGKTQLALHYAHAAVNGEQLAGQYLAYDYVVWLNAELFLEGQFQAMAELWLGQQLKADEARAEVYAFLRGKRSLFVFDNAENARSIQAFLPPPHYNSALHLLITSRSGEWGGMPIMKLEGFSIEEASEYIEYHLGPQPKEKIGTLVELLEGLPLAMSQAVSYIKAGHCTLESFEEHFYLNQANLLSHELIEEESHPKTVGTTLTLALAQAKAQNPIVEKLLGIAAYLSPENIKLELLIAALKSKKGEILRGIEVLESYSLLSRERETGNVQIHRLVQEVMRHRHKFLSDPNSYWEMAFQVLKGIVIYDDRNLEAMVSCNFAIGHVQQLCKAFKEYDFAKEQTLSLAELLVTCGLHQQTMGNYEIAKNFQAQALIIQEACYGTDHPLVSRTLHNLGVAHGELGDASKEKDLLERALVINERHYGENHFEVAETLVNLANAYGALGNNRKKKELLERALIILEEHYGNNHPSVATALFNLGTAYGLLGDTTKKKDLLKRALSILKANYGNNHPKVATALVNLGNAYGNLGNARKKKELLERSLLILESHYGRDHLEVARTLLNLGNAYGNFGNARRQKDLLERALLILESHYGTEHPQVAIALNNLGKAYGDLGNVRKQKHLLERALTILEANYGTDHPEVISTLVNLSNAYAALADIPKQKELLERAFIISETHLGINHPEVAITLVNLGNAYGALGDTHKKKDLLERALIINETHFGIDHPELAPALVNLGNVYGDLGNMIKKRDLLERVLLILEAHCGIDHPSVANTLSNLGNAYGTLGDIRKAKDSLERALTIKEAHYGTNHPEVAPTLVNLSIAYGASGDFARQKDLLKRALIIDEKHYGSDHLEVGKSLFNLANACIRLNQYSEAKQYATKVYRIFSRHYGQSHPNTQRARDLLHKCEEKGESGEEESLLPHYEFGETRSCWKCIIS